MCHAPMGCFPFPLNPDALAECITHAQVDDLDTVSRVVKQEYHVFVHPDYGTHMRLLNDEVKFAPAWRANVSGKQ